MFELIMLSKNCHVLPRPGGLLDQDSFFVYMLSAAEQAQADRVMRESKKK